MLTSTITLEGNLAAQPELRFTGNGTPVVDLTILVNRRISNDAGQWSDGEPTRHRVAAFGTLAENIAGSLSTGDRVIVTGDLHTEAWDDRESGEKRTGTKIIADAVGASLRWNTVTTGKQAKDT